MDTLHDTVTNSYCSGKRGCAGQELLLGDTHTVSAGDDACEARQAVGTSCELMQRARAKTKASARGKNAMLQLCGFIER